MAGLRSRVILITGATSCIGRSTALSFAQIGAKLALVGMKTKDTDSKEASYESQRLEKISEECKHLGAADVHIGQYDVTNRDGCRIALEEATESFRGKYNYRNFKKTLVFPDYILEMHYNILMYTFISFFEQIT